ncbi:unnamed protein product [Schistosoma margrebowiei]|uniref:Uncharacterized protein n=1 Tax=Schistosoma margrebowiei TaxID=48269 RepID=A0A183LC07_9TREM|nr:unnamed protein product [Schistosoma margrebowiei]
MVVGGGQQETLDPDFVLLGTHEQGVPVILRKLVSPDRFDPVSPNFTVRDVTTAFNSAFRSKGRELFLKLKPITYCLKEAVKNELDKLVGKRIIILIEQSD